MDDKEYERMLAEYENMHQLNTVNENPPNNEHSAKQIHHSNFEMNILKPATQRDPTDRVGNSKLGAGKQNDDTIDEGLNSSQIDPFQQVYIISDPKELKDLPINSSWKNLLNQQEAAWRNMLHEHEAAWKNLLNIIQEEIKVEEYQQGAESGQSDLILKNGKNNAKENLDFVRRKNDLSPKIEQKVSNARAIREKWEEERKEAFGKKSKSNVQSPKVNNFQLSPKKNSDLISPKKISLSSTSSPKKERDDPVKSLKRMESDKITTIAESQMKSGKKTTESLQKKTRLTVKRDLSRGYFKNLNPYWRGVCGHYSMDRKRRERLEDIEIYERCDRWETDVIANPKDYDEIILLDSQKIEPEELTDEDEITNFNYLEMDKQFDIVVQPLKIPQPEPTQNLMKINPQQSAPTTEKMPEEALPARQGVFVDMSVDKLDPRTVRMSYVYRGSNENNITQKKKLLFGHRGTKETLELDKYDLISPDFNQKEFQNGGTDTSPLKIPKKKTLMPLQSAPNSLVNIPEPKYNSLFNNNAPSAPVTNRTKIIEKSWEYNFHHSRKYPPARIQRSRSLTSLEANQLKKIKAKWYNVDWKLETSKHPMKNVQRRYSLNFVKMNKESVNKMNKAEQLIFEEPWDALMKIERERYPSAQGTDKRQSMNRSPFVVPGGHSNTLDSRTSVERLKRLLPNSLASPSKPVIKRARSSGKLEPLNHKATSLDQLPKSCNVSPNSTWFAYKASSGSTTDRPHAQTEYKPVRSLKPLSPQLNLIMRRSKSRESIEKVSAVKKMGVRRHQSQRLEWNSSYSNPPGIKSLPASPNKPVDYKALARKLNDKLGNGSLSQRPMFVVQRPQYSFWRPTRGRSLSLDKIKTQPIKQQVSSDVSKAQVIDLSPTRRPSFEVHSTPQIEDKKPRDGKSIATIELLRQQMLAQQKMLMQTMLLMKAFKQPAIIISRPSELENSKENSPQLQKQEQTRVQKRPVEKRKKFYRIRRYLWTIAYPKLLDIYSETEVMQRVEEIRRGLAAIRDQTEDLLVQHFIPAIQDNMIRWRDEKNLIYQAVQKPDVTQKEIADTRFNIEAEIVNFIREIFDRTTTAADPEGASPDYNPHAEAMPEAFLLYLGNFSMNKVLIPSGFLSLFELRRLQFSPKFSKLIIKGREGNIQAMMVITMIIFVRILIHKILLNPGKVFPDVFKQPQDAHPVFFENIKFISSIIYQGIMDLYAEKLDDAFNEDNDNNVRHVSPADPIFVPGTNLTAIDEEEVIYGLYSKEEIRARMKTDIEYHALKLIFFSWGQTMYSLIEKTWESTALEIKRWKTDPTKKKAFQIAKQDPLLKNAVFRAILRPIELQ